MKRRSLKMLLVCCCLVCCAGALLSAQAQGGGGHPAGPPPGGHPPGFPPSGAPSNSGGNGGGYSGNGGAGASAANIARGGIKVGPPGRWWDDHGFVQTLGLSRGQQKKMDAVFNANKPALIATYKDFVRQQAALQAIGKGSNVDKTKLFAAIDAVNQARSALEKANTEMLLQIRAELDPKQAAKLEELP